MKSFLRRLRHSPLSVVFLSGSAMMLVSCAPQLPSGGEEAVETPTRRPAPALVMVTATPRPGEADITARPTPAPLATLDPDNPDWELRYQQLYDIYLSRFNAPSVGTPVELVLAGGQARSGVLLGLDESKLELDVGDGVITLTADSLAEESKTRFFKQHFAHQRALEQGRVEYQRWKRMREMAEIPDPTPVPTRELASRPFTPHTLPGPGTDGVNSGHRVDANAEPPRNEGTTGRVWQVDQYLRQNSAVPHSLRYKAWGKVEPHGDGYKVRVQYSVEAAENFGTSHEDMVFFMHADGKVYRRAPVK